MVNVVGDGIGDWTDNRGKIGSGKNYSYFGTFSKMVSTVTGGTVTVKIKKGSLRYIQLIGVKSTIGCPSNVTASDLKSTAKFPGLFIIGTERKNIFQSESITIKTSYSVNSTSDLRYEEDEPLPESIDQEPPTVGVLTVSFTSDTTASISWPAASDEGTLTKYLSYKLLRADTPEEIDTVEEADSTAAQNIVFNWTMNKTTQSVTELDSSKEHHFALLVKDQFNNKSLYSLTSEDETCSCPAGQYLEGGECITAELGYWANNCVLTACTNKPSNSNYTSTAQTTSSCAWECSEGYILNVSTSTCELPSEIDSIGCSSGQRMTGLFVNVDASNKIYKFGARCKNFVDGNVSGSAFDGTSSGAEGGTRNEIDCNGQYVVVGEIKYENGILEEQNVLTGISFQCMKINGDLENNWSNVFGTLGVDSPTIKCTNPLIFRTIKVGPSGTYAGTINDIDICE